MGGDRRVDDQYPLLPAEFFVASMAADLELAFRAVDVRRRGILLRLTRWAVAEGFGLDRETILDPAVVERFCATERRGRPRKQPTGLICVGLAPN